MTDTLWSLAASFISGGGGGGGVLQQAGAFASVALPLLAGLIGFAIRRYLPGLKGYLIASLVVMGVLGLVHVGIAAVSEYHEQVLWYEKMQNDDTGCRGAEWHTTPHISLCVNTAAALEMSPAWRTYHLVSSRLYAAGYAWLTSWTTLLTVLGVLAMVGADGVRRGARAFDARRIAKVKAAYTARAAYAQPVAGTGEGDEGEEDDDE